MRCLRACAVSPITSAEDAKARPRSSTQRCAALSSYALAHVHARLFEPIEKFSARGFLGLGSRSAYGRAYLTTAIGRLSAAAAFGSSRTTSRTAVSAGEIGSDAARQPAATTVRSASVLWPALPLRRECSPEGRWTETPSGASAAHGRSSESMRTRSLGGGIAAVGVVFGAIRGKTYICGAERRLGLASTLDAMSMKKTAFLAPTLFLALLAKTAGAASQPSGGRA